MGTSTRGTSIQTAYGWYREGQLLVNRRGVVAHT